MFIATLDMKYRLMAAGETEVEVREAMRRGYAAYRKSYAPSDRPYLYTWLQVADDVNVVELQSGEAVEEGRVISRAPSRKLAGRSRKTVATS